LPSKEEAIKPIKYKVPYVCYIQTTALGANKYEQEVRIRIFFPLLHIFQEPRKLEGYWF